MSSIRVELELSDGSFVSGLLRAGQSLTSFRSELARTNTHYRKFIDEGKGVIVSANKIDTSHRTLLGTMRDVSVVTGGLVYLFHSLTGASSGLIGAIVRVNADIERMRFQMEGMSRAANPIREAADNVEYLRQKATEVPFSLKEIATTFTKLKAAGTDPMAGSLQALADGIAAFGGGDEQLHRVTLGVTQMVGKSVIQMEEMRQQLGESMPTAMRIMAESMGVSIAELTAAISTGRVQAIPALESFYAELERTYGGTAQRMMQTFSGQVTQMNANLQRLATEPGLQNFVNVTLKDMLLRFNEFLKSDRAKIWANQFGEALSSMALAGESFVRFLYDIRDELKILGTALVGFVGFKVFGAAARAVSLQLGQFRLKSLALGQTLDAAAQASIAAAQAQGKSWHTFGIQAGRATNVVGALSTRTGFAAKALRLVAGAGLAAVPVVGLVATTVIGAAEYFGLFSDKVREAYDELKEFGASSRRAADEIISAQESKLRTDIENLRRIASNAGSLPESRWAPRYVQQLKDLEDQLASVMESREELIARAGEREAEITQRTLETQIADRRRAQQQEYARQKAQLSEEYNLALQGGEAQLAARERYQEGLRLISVETAKNDIEIVTKMIQEQEAILAAATDEFHQKRTEDSITFLQERLAQLTETLSNAEQREFGIDLGPGLKDIDQLVKEGTTRLGNLREEVSSLSDELAGTATLFAEVNRAIERGDYGTIEEGGEAVAQLHAELREAARQADILSDIVEGQTALDRDIARARQQALEEAMDLEEKRSGIVLSEAERIRRRLDSGFYQGLGPLDNILTAVEGLNGKFITSKSRIEDVGESIKTEGFGNEAAGAVDQVREAVDTLNRSLGAVVSTLSGIDVGGSLAFDASTGQSGGMLGLIRRAEGTAGPNGYNTSLGYGAYLPGGQEQNLTSKTLNEILELQKGMLAHPDNTYNSSALGAYQIVSKTLRSLIEEMGLTGNELFSPAMQDRMAERLLARRSGQGLAGLRNEWEGLRRIDNATILATLGQPTAPRPSQPALETPPVIDTGPENPEILADRQSKTQEAQMELNRIAALEAMNQQEEWRQAREAYLSDLKQHGLDIQTETEEVGQNYASLRDAIREGSLGESRDENDPAYSDLIAQARELDRQEAEMEKRRDARADADRDRARLTERQGELTAKLADEQARLRDPNYAGESDDLRKLNAELQEYVNLVRAAYGEDSQEYANALKLRADALASNRRLEATARQVELEAERRERSQASMTERERLRFEMNEKIREIERARDASIAAGESEVEATRRFEAQKAAIREQYASQLNPVREQMRDWADIDGQLAEKSTQWTDQAASGIAGLITGTSSLHSVISGMFEDVVNMGVRWMFGSMSEGKGAGGKAAGVATKGKDGGFLSGVFHTGGIIGQARSFRRTSPGMFANAPRYHTGGIIGDSLLPSERPTITKVGEGVFTPEQMKALAPVGSQVAPQISISAPVNVNGGGGTPEQNNDLARKIARGMEENMRTIVVEELINQRRAGNMLNGI